jgi:hypothetical protein
MIKAYSNRMESDVFRWVRITLIGLVVLLTTGCGPGGDDGTEFATLELPTDTLLNFRCADVGIFTETCVLVDSENPFATVAVNEVDINNPDLKTKFDLLNEIPPDTPTESYAKARFYLWATALARNSNGENQYFTALALHELWDAQLQYTGFQDPLVQQQAIRAYRSVLDNYFGSVTFFGPFGNPPVVIPAQLNLLVGDNLYRPAATGFSALFPTQLAALAAIGTWGYTYIPCTVTCPDDGFLFVNNP